MTTKGQTFGDIYRTIDEERMLDLLLLEGYAYALDMDAARNDARQALNRWVKAGLGMRQGDRGQRLFDPVEVACHLKFAGQNGEDDFWDRCFVTTLRRFVTDLKPAESTRITLDFRRTFNTALAPAGKALRLRMPLPLESRYAEFNIQPDMPAEVVSHAHGQGRLDARVAAADGSPVTLGARLDLVVQPGADLPPPSNLDVYLKPNEGLIVVTDRINDLAERLGGGLAPEAAIRIFWDFLLDEWTFSPLHYDQIPAEAPLDWVIESGCYDCQLASALFAGLCRARGIPVRLVGGHFLYERSPTNHYWAEVWLDHKGWTPFDFLSWDLSKGGVDPVWRDHFFGRVDARLVTQSLPEAFTGALGLPVPPAWHILRTMKGEGVDIELAGLDGIPIYRDHVALLSS